MSSISDEVDVLVIGGGNAGFCSAISAAESGAHRVLLIDACPEDWAGGNSYFTAGAFRTVHHGLADILPIVNSVDQATASRIDIEPYTAASFTDDIARICVGRSDPGLSRTLVQDSNTVIKWLAKHGVRFQLSFNRQAYEIDGRFKFWGGMCLKTQDGGKGLIEDERRAAEKLGITVRFSTAAKHLVVDPATKAVSSVIVEDATGEREIRTGAVILAAGGFEANPRMRAQFLGPNWDFAKVRGTPYNTGSCLEMAIRDVSAKQAGNWSGCHSVAWDANAPPNSGHRLISNEFTKSGYPLGLMVNIDGQRFVDEGVDMRNYTYAIFGKAILAQPGHSAFQVWDATMTPWLRDEEYREDIVERITASTIEELAEKCAHRGLKNPQKFVSTIREYNEAVAAFERENRGRHKWDPAVKDGLSTQSSQKQLALAKSNWATPLTKGPYLAVKVTCGVTFTFGGLAVDHRTAGVISSATNSTVPGLYCVGEMLGGLFYDNYPGGSGLMSGAVFGRRAGRAVAARASKTSPARL
ncbi:FAD binding domain-containing protein [Aspergillus cavernicola]|uniref:FAD binding domain-containing protein n=1 Tax=Aspergillus cavernicola TaxID=176166 RepID=A0ABR4HQI7_9EURO